MEQVALVVFDVAGTTAKDEGLVVEAFGRAIKSQDEAYSQTELDEKVEYVRATMGQRKIDVFMHLYNDDVVRATQAHDDFVSSYIQLIHEGRLEEFDGISDLFVSLRADGITVAITTGFPREILDPIIEVLEWREKIDISVAASEVAQGRPAPDMINRCIEIAEKSLNIVITADQVGVVGDTESDMRSAVAAGALYAIGVTTGEHSREQLEQAGATHVLSAATLIRTIF
ncbi:MAG: HAD hydrolase-like protein [Actinomycetes bacterium]